MRFLLFRRRVGPLTTSAERREEAPDLLRVADVGGPVHAQQVRLLDYADLQLDGQHESGQPNALIQVGTGKVKPTLRSSR